MLKIVISGCNGRMGQVVTRMCSQRDDMTVVAGFDRITEKLSGYPVYADPVEYSGPADVVIDFSNPSALSGLLGFCKGRSIPVVLCTTGYSAQQLDEIREASLSIPVFKSGNMSVGINLMVKLVQKAAAVLGEGFDVEIVERHHRTKVDAPSGTAVMLADAAASALPHESEYVYERQSVRQPRGKNEIGISSVRGGTIVGEHSVMFAGRDEIITISHSARSREIFAVGGLNAALFMVGKPKGLYNMGDLIGKC